jgi:hypothetical protein
MTQVKSLLFACLVSALSGCIGDSITGPIDWSIPPTPSTNVMTPTSGVIYAGMATLKGMPGDTLTLSVVVKRRSNKKVIANAIVDWRQSIDGLAYFVTPSTRTNAAGIATTKLVLVRYFVEHQAIAHSKDAPDITFNLRPTYLR